MIKTNFLIAGAALASAAMFAANPAFAANVTYDWSFDGLAGTGGTFVADESGVGVLQSISGTVGNVPIINLLPPGSIVSAFGANNDNLIPVTAGGWGLDGGDEGQWNLSSASGGGVFFLQSELGVSIMGELVYQQQAVPEPLTIIGSITAAGFGIAFKKRKKDSNKV